MRHLTTPCESLLPRKCSRQSEGGGKHLLTAGFPVFSGWSWSISAFLPTFPKAEQSQAYRALPYSQCFPEHTPNTQSQTVYPKPKRSSEDKPMPESSAHLRTQTYARCRRLKPWSSAHIRSHKQARSRKLSEQRKDRESMTSSTIFNTIRVCHLRHSPQWSLGEALPYNLPKVGLALMRIFLNLFSHRCLYV